MPAFDDPAWAAIAHDTRQLLIERLAKAIGFTQAEALIQKTSRGIGIPDHALMTRDDAIRVLDVLIAREGLVGVAARFLKVRMLLVAR